MSNKGWQFGKDDLQPSQHRSMGFFSTMALWIGANLVVTTILTGQMFIPDLSIVDALLMVLVGSAIGGVFIALMGSIGTITGMPTMVLARGAFGKKGAALPSLVNTIILIGWCWIQALLAGISLNYAVEATTGYNNVFLFTIITQIIVVTITLFGHRGIEATEKIIAVAMVILSGAVFWRLFHVYDVNALLTMPTESVNGVSMIVAFDIVVATAFSWIPTVADFNRNAKSVKKGAIGTWIGYLIATIIAMGTGIVIAGLSVMTGMESTYDPTVLLANYGFGVPAALVIFASVVSTNVMALYSASMSFLSVRQSASFWKVTSIIGVITIIGSTWNGLLDSFFDFVLLIATLFVPIFAIVLSDFFILRKRNYDSAELLSTKNEGAYWYYKGYNPIAFVVYIIGAVLTYLWVYVTPLSIGATIPSFFVTAILYLVATKLFGHFFISKTESLIEKNPTIKA